VAIARALDACCKTKIRNAKTHRSTEQVCIKLVRICSQADSCVLLFRGVRSMCVSETRPAVRFEQGSGSSGDRWRWQERSEPFVRWMHFDLRWRRAPRVWEEQVRESYRRNRFGWRRAAFHMLRELQRDRLKESICPRVPNRRTHCRSRTRSVEELGGPHHLDATTK
jgi:hypothetical protein